MKKITNYVLILILGSIAICLSESANAADANLPERMTYQGYLVDGNGNPLGNSAPANYDVVFRIYEAKQGGTAIWAEQQTVTVDKGYFSVLLGEGAATASGEPRGNLSGAFDGADVSDRFIGITVSTGGTPTEIAPRLRLLSSPYAFTASQARKISDSNGNANFQKDGSTLKLGAGATPTLTLPEGGGATLSGRLFLEQPAWGWAIDIKNGTSRSYIGAPNGAGFQIYTESPNIYLNKELQVNGNIRSYNSDTIIGPSNNTDTYLKVQSGVDKITAQADEFQVQGDSNYLLTKFTSNKAELHTDAGSIYMNKALSVTGAIESSSDVKSGQDVYLYDDIRFTNANGNAWMIPTNPDGNKGTLYQRFNEVKIEGSGKLTVGGVASVEGNIVAVYGGSPTVSLRDSDNKDYYMHANADRLYFLRGEGLAGWDSYRPITIFQGDKVGINNESPAEDLHIVHGTNGSYSKGLRIQRSGGSYWAIGVDYSGDLIFDYNRGDSGTWIGYVNDSNGAWVSTSDKKLKKDIEPMAPVLDRLDRLKPSRYRFKTQEEDEPRSYGFIAQDVEALFPDMVSNEKEQLGLNYSDFAVLSVKAVQELRAEKDRELADKQGEIDDLKARLAKLEEVLAKMENDL